MTNFYGDNDPLGEAMFEMMDDIARGRVVTDMFTDPRPEEVDAVERERAAGLEELDLYTRGFMRGKPAGSADADAEGEGL